MSEQKQKVSDLPENEQKELIAEAYAVGLKGFNFTSYKVETLKEKIAEAKAKNEEQKDEQKSEDSKEQNAQDSKNEKEVIVAGDGGVHEIPSEDEQNAENVNNDEKSKSDKSIPEEASDETKAFLNDGNEFTANADTPAPAGETDNLPDDAEVITEDEAQKLEQKAEEIIPGEKLPKTEEPKKVNGICHICGSKVIEGVCTGCGFKKV